MQVLRIATHSLSCDMQVLTQVLVLLRMPLTQVLVLLHNTRPPASAVCLEIDDTLVSRNTSLLCLSMLSVLKAVLC